ncbi:hypothetical protein AAE02nite_30590 [Adhaeribacter aerolatus]|uniref:Carboxypeptidase-like regulatory domain-containing protein n=2 Tax=Adhaeribacter aerolatus TaxID=670289 RepID=A0A512B0A9_9BACT|nr:hypothetical protein AAE02nite_30590 [Adhaeribacter aerolatus]
MDEKSNAPIPFAHITVIDEKISAEADNKGEFTLLLKPENKNGKIRITSLGYLTQEFSIAALMEPSEASTIQKLYLVPDYKSLQEVEIKARARKLKTKKAGYHIGEGTSIHYEFYPSDTLKIKVPGHEIGNRIQLDKYPATLRNVSFGLQGLSEARLLMRIRLYSLKNNLPHLNLLPESAVIAIPPHHAGWITVNMQEYNIKLTEDFVVVVEWDAHRERNTSSLMAFASIPQDQVIYYRESNLAPWQIVKSTLVNIKSIGMYATVVYEK